MMERIKTLDFSKGVAILVIVFLHAMFCQPGMSQGSAGSSILIDYLYGGLFLFFLITGYLYNSSRDVGRSIRRRMLQVVLTPTVFLLLLPALLYMYYAVMGIQVLFQDYVDCLPFLIGGDNLFQPLGTLTSRPMCGVFPGYYFLQAMAVAVLIFLPTAKYVVASLARLLSAVVILLLLTFMLIGTIGANLPYFAQLAPTAACFMYLGAYARKYDLMYFIDNGWRTRRYWVVFLFSLAATVVLLALLPTGHAFDYGHFGAYGAYSVFPFFITYVFGCYSMMVIVSFAVRIPILSAAVCYCGKNTLMMLLLHAFIIKLVSSPFYGVETASWFPAMPAWFAVIAAVVAIAVSLMTSHVWKAVRCRSIWSNTQD